jgi:hypothetical protein
VSQESDVTDATLGRKEWQSTVRLFGANSLKEGACEVFTGCNNRRDTEVCKHATQQ